MKKIIDVAETAVLTMCCYALIGVMLFEHMIYNVIEIFESGRE